MDAAAALRASQHGVELRVKYEGRYPEGAPSYTVAVGCDANFAAGADVDAAIADLTNFLTPAPIREIEGWLAELSVIVARRVGDEFDEALRLTAYASRLSLYPADVVRDAVLKHSWQFWPTWAELERICTAGAGARKQMVNALRRGPRQPEPEWRPPTDDEKARIAALIEEQFPDVSRAWKEAALAAINKANET
jgi:hypothetical protein